MAALAPKATHKPPSAKVIDLASRRGFGGRLEPSEDLVELRDKADRRLMALRTARNSWWSHHRDLARWINPRYAVAYGVPMAAPCAKETFSGSR